MQAQTNKFINDRKSVELELEKLKELYDKESSLDEWSMERKIIVDYNKDDDYAIKIRIK